MLNVIIGIVVIIIIIYLAVVVYQRTQLKQAKAMNLELTRLKNLSLTDQLQAVKQLTLTGDSLTKFQEAQKKYQDVQQTQFPDVAQSLTAAENDAKGVNFLQTRDDVDQAHAKLEAAATNLDQVQATLTNIQKMEQAHQQAVVDLETNYQKLRKTLLNDNSKYGPAIDALEGQLSSIEDTFADFSALTKKGDHQNAEVMLGDLKQATMTLEQKMESIPELYQLNHEQFVNQLQEIESAYAKSRAEGFCFADDDFSMTLKELHQAVQDNLENIKHLDLSFVREQDNEIEKRINGLYDRLETEMNARLFVDKQLDVIGRFIQHAWQQNKTLADELERLSHNYSLEHGEVENTDRLQEQISLINQKYQGDCQTIKDHQAIYSQIAADLKQFQQSLTNIEKKQRALNDSIADLSEEEQQAQQTLEDLNAELHAIHRRIENLNLPGISADYAEYFEMVSKEVQHLKATMNKAKISMDDVQKQLEQIKHDRDQLQEKTSDLIDQSLLAEQVIQYANRYAATNPAMAASIHKAQQQFERDYRYEDSLATIANALDQVEPGAFTRIEDNYYKNKAKTN
ncbi:septation ring formation regulator EzrA [Fructilactobacillus cliffordii]|uniref:septation ring formation regulator EzrA n=1 Tax=Fructilactobacillus cliffordii TaxID=2940299 RepID=UPI002093AA3C|nr:septation ring formation regulator EzrA [Fructilactobacillus cliffordii]USS86827.1 septation ring formation regulator EzrA [Fructilactobacillus cliffordii]